MSHSASSGSDLPEIMCSVIVSPDHTCDLKSIVLKVH
jgi:hypothetical protein